MKSLRATAALAVSALVISLMGVAFTAAPASAATYNIGITDLRGQATSPMPWSMPVILQGTVIDHTGRPVPPNGVIHLQFLPDGSSAWTDVAVHPTPAFDLRHAVMGPGHYRLVVPAFSDGAGNVYNAFIGQAVRFEVMRKATVQLRKRTRSISGRVAPSYKRGPVVLVRAFSKDASRWSNVKKVRTSRRGHYAFKLPRPRRTTFYRVKVPGRGMFVTGLSWQGVKTTVRSHRGRAETTTTPSTVPTTSAFTTPAPGDDLLADLVAGSAARPS